MSTINFGGPSPILIRVGGEGFEFLRELAKHFPAETRRASGWVASTLLKRMRRVMASGGGVHGAPKFEPWAFITAALRGRGPIGGVLARPSSFVMYKSRNSIVLGWPSGLDEYGSAFQTAEKREFSKDERKAIYRATGWDRTVIHAVRSFGYDRPARPVIEPVVEGARPEIPKWLTVAAIKAIANSKRAAKMKATIRIAS